MTPKQAAHERSVIRKIVWMFARGDLLFRAGRYTLRYELGQWWSTPDGGGERSVRCHATLPEALRRAHRKRVADVVDRLLAEEQEAP